MKVVLDTNVWVSGLLFPGGPPDRIVRAILTGQINNGISPDILTELRRILLQKFKVAEGVSQGLIHLSTEASTLVYPTERIGVIKSDPADNRILECAVTFGADMIITGDTKHLLPIKTYKKIAILSPRIFLDKTGRI